MHRQTRSFRLGVRETFPAGELESLRVDRSSYPVNPMPAQASSIHNNLGHRGADPGQPSTESLEASFSAQKRAVRLSSDRPSPALTQKAPIESFSEKTPLGQLGLEERTREASTEKTLPPTSLTLTSLSLRMRSCNHRVQLRKALEAMHQAVHSLDAKLAKAKASKQNDNNNNNNNNMTTQQPPTTPTSTTTIPTTITTTTTTTTTRTVESRACKASTLTKPIQSQNQTWMERA